VLFPAEYLQEFTDIFDHDQPPAEPTVYLCAQEACHGRTGWAEQEPVFVMANAPAEPENEARPPEVWEALGRTVLERLDAAGLRASGDAIVWERTPTQLAAAFPGSRGSIYGAASNSPLSAFRRPANQVRSVRGLFLASGSAHPGGGVPLCLLSGQAAAEAALADRA
jgi:phytoene dehydrogenase-like protein